MTDQTDSPSSGTLSPAAVLLQDFSLEMTGKDVPALLDSVHAISVGTKVNVTFLGNEDLDMRVAAARAVRDNGFLPVPHISARRLHSEQETREFLEALQAVNATESVFVVGGDPSEPMGPYDSSTDLIASGLFAEYGVKEVNIAGYPEGHPDITDAMLWDHLQRKSALLKDQGLQSTILTQFGFDADPIIDWVREVRARGIDSTIRLGIPGPAGIKRLLSYAKRFGVATSAGIVKKYGFSITNLLGTAGPDKFVADLAERLAAEPTAGDVKVHLYAFGGLQATSEWARDFSAGVAR
ncbi:methylenetetrahydrofolate reductase [Kocuria sp. M1N1S27]|uniref:methylenetetrahydrofolate reductase n=1 Tax=Kocuria kalidii TaxID=3376283 RepID=UPI00378A29F2